MRKTKTSVSLLFFLFSFIITTAQKAPVDAKWVITQSIQKMGGEELLRSVKTLYTEMSTEMDGRPVTWVTKEMLPNKGAFQIVYQGRTVYEDWFNGTQGFERVNGEVKQANPNSLTDKFPRKNIFNELDYLDTSLYKLQLLAEAKVGNTDCYKVRAVFVTGDERHLYIDKTAFNTIKEDRIRRGETAVSTTSSYSGFKKYGDLLFYSTMSIGEGAEAQKASITKLLVNQEISESDFNKQ
jgi:hypothetical protein